MFHFSTTMPPAKDLGGDRIVAKIIILFYFRWISTRKWRKRRDDCPSHSSSPIVLFRMPALDSYDAAQMPTQWKQSGREKWIINFMQSCLKMFWFWIFSSYCNALVNMKWDASWIGQHVGRIAICRGEMKVHSTENEKKIEWPNNAFNESCYMFWAVTCSA